jgi:hypothetical protein
MPRKYQAVSDSFKTKWAVNSKHKTCINGRKEKKEEEDKGKIEKYL